MTKSPFIFSAFLLLIFMNACKKEVQDLNSAVTSDAQVGASTSTRTFSATANVTGCIGYNITFGGVIEVLTQAVVSGSVTKTYIRQWSIKGLTATGGGKTYDVIAGHEMFAVQGPTTFSGIGMPTNPLTTDVFIHQGTLVLQNTADPSDKLVIRHEIVKRKSDETNMDMPRMGWFINGQHCGD